MPKPPKSTPSSDIDGIHRDEARNTDVAEGEGAEGLENARKGNAARPDQSKGEKNRDDRSN